MNVRRILLLLLLVVVLSCKAMVIFSFASTEKKDISDGYFNRLRSSYEYTGNKIQPRFEVMYDLIESKDNGDGTVSVTNYLLILNAWKDYGISYENNKCIGTARVTATGRGEYNGSLTGSFKIVPGKTNLKNVKPGKGKITVKVSKSKGAGAYQYAYKRNHSKSWKTKSSENIRKTLKGLRPGKRYLVKARAYKRVNGRRYFGHWSNTKAVKVK